MQKTILISLLFTLLITACEKSESTPSVNYFRTWQEIEPAGLLQYTGSSYLRLALRDDSTFQLKLKSWGDLIIQGDPCAYVYDYYVKGTFSVVQDEIFLDGCYTDSTYATCQPNCGGILNYSSHYRHTLSPDSLIFNPGDSWTRRRDMIPVD